jgi:type I restriction enzyme, S subunit
MEHQRLDAVAAITMGQAPEGESYNLRGEGLPLIAGAGDFGERHPEPKKFTTAPGKTCRTGDIILGIRASIGEKVLADGTYCLGRGVASIRAKSLLDGRYLWHWLTRAAPDLAAKAKGATFKQVNREDIGELAVPIPPLPEQRRIAEILDKAEALLAKRRATLAQIEPLTRSIFLDMFGDPIANPRRWPNPTLGGVLTFQQYGPRFYNERYSESGVRIVRITDLDAGGQLSFSTMPQMDVSDDDKEKYLLRPGDVLFARTGATVGKVAMIRNGDPPCIAGAYFITMRFDARVTPQYAYAVLSARSIRELVTQRSRQAAQQNFSGPGLRRLPLPVPPIELQRTFAETLQVIESIRVKQAASHAKLDVLFNALQYAAFRGELHT